MATVLKRNDFGQDGISVAMLTGLSGIAIAVDAYPAVSVSEAVVRLVTRLRADGTISPDYLLGIAFRGAVKPDREASVALHDLCVYLAIKNLQESAIANAEAFLDEIQAAQPEAFEIATFKRNTVRK